MTQGDFFQLGIEIPVNNWKFETWDRYAFLKSTVTAGVEILTADSAGATIDLRLADNALNTDSAVTLGPSTHINNPGATETLTIAALYVDGANYAIDFTASLTYDYMVGDPILFRSAPLAWTPLVDGGNPANRIYAQDTGLKYGTSANAIDYGIGYAAKITREAAGAGISHKLTQYTGINTLLPDNGVHRLSAYGKGTGDLSKLTIALDTYKSDLTLVNTGAATLLYPAASNYTFASATFTPAAGTTRGLIRIFVDSAPSILTTFSATNIIIEHSGGLNSSGYYTATEYPDEGSIKFDKITRDQNIELVNNTLGYYDSSGARPRFWYTCQFADVRQAFYDSMLMLDKWCRQGHNIVFRPMIDDLPAVMVGKIRVTEFNKQFWNLTYRSFSFRFEEV